VAAIEPELNNRAANVDSEQILADLKSRYIKRLQWLSEMRWFATGAVSLTIVFAAAMSLQLPLVHLVGSLTALIITNIAYSSVTQKLDASKTSLTGIFRLFYVEIATDFLILTWLIHLAGGATNLFAYCFVFHIIVASVMAPSIMNYGLAAVATALVSAMALCEHYGFIDHYELGAWAAGTHDINYVIHFLMAFAAVMFVTAYVSSAVGAMLKRREEYLSELHAELKQWSAQVSKSNDRLIEIDRTKTEFMRMSAHEIRSPVSSMLTVMQTIIDGYVVDNEQIVRMLKLSADRANDALKLSKELLTLAREKSRDLELENLDVSMEITDVAATHQQMAREKGIELRSELPLHTIRSVYDSLSLNLALSHMLENAIAYSPDHGGPVTLRFRADRGSAEDRGYGPRNRHYRGRQGQDIPGVLPRQERPRAQANRHGHGALHREKSVGEPRREFVVHEPHGRRRHVRPHVAAIYIDILLPFTG